ncbi:MAG: tetratricopeptide repeat protein [Candidatus Omnitrophica bacterium]|nr:tetratricopeptide repeat protein [Candidatus Omnitrophota bacterium]
MNIKKAALFGWGAYFVFLAVSQAYALDWKDLHERADQIDAVAARQLIQENRDSLEGLYVLGLVYLNERKNAQALQLFDKMLGTDPDCIEAKWGRAEVLRRQRNIEESEKILNEVIKEKRKFAPAYISLSYIKYMQMEFSESVRLAYKVKNFGQDDVDLSNYTRAYLLIGGGKGMLAHYGGPVTKFMHGTGIYPNLKKAEKLQPDAPAVLFGLGSFYFLAPGVVGGDIDKAQDYLERAVKADPDFADAYVRLAQVYRMKGDEQKYQRYIEKAFQLDPQNELALDEQSGECKFICISLSE